MTVWYTADTHFGHENIIMHCARPFRSASHMDSVLIENMWKVVKPEDTLWIVGDFAFGRASKDVEWLEAMFGQLPGAEKHLVVGNHDCGPTRCLPWTSVSHMAEVKDGGRRGVLCHYPMITWNGARRGALQLFGHVHGQWLGTRNSVNVGVDVWDFMPVTFTDIERRARELAVNLHWEDVERGTGLA